MKKILITGATGHFGKFVIDYLLKQNITSTSIAALVRDEAKASDLKKKGIDLRMGNYHDYPSLVKAFTGVDKLLLVSSSEFNDRSGQHINAVNAAKEAGVTHIIYTSVQSKQDQPSAIPFVVQSHFDTENAIKDSGLTYTILRNTLYADTLPLFIGEKVVDTGVFLPAGKGKVPFATRKDMAEAAAVVLITPGHENKTYGITATTSYTLADVAQILSDLAGKDVLYTDPEPAHYKETIEKAGVPPEFSGVLTGFAQAMKQDEFDQPDTTLEKLLGRKPTSLKEYLTTTFFTTNN